MRVAPVPAYRAPAVRSIGLVAALAILVLAGCGTDKTTDPPVAGSTTYTGTATGATTSGLLTVTVATSTPAPQQGSFRAQTIVTASGTFTPSGGAAVNLTGQYDDQGNALFVSGGGWTFAGGLTTFGMEGNYTGPASATGVFSLQKGGSEVTVIIGTYLSALPATGDDGNFNISISGTAVHGNAVPNAGGTPTALDGTYTAANGDIAIVNPANPTGPALAQGTYNSTNGTASGTYDTGTTSGTWSGTKVP